MAESSKLSFKPRRVVKSGIEFGSEENLKSASVSDIFSVCIRFIDGMNSVRQPLVTISPYSLTHSAEQPDPPSHRLAGPSPPRHLRQ